MCAKRDQERGRYSKVPAFDATKSGRVNLAPKPVTDKPSSKSTLSFEELMKRADENNVQKPQVQSTRPVPISRTMKSEPSRLKSNSSSNSLRKSVTKKRSMNSKIPSADLIKLNQNKRDLRSIEQIQHELKIEKRK